jgi:hypothetical protein
MVRLSNDRDWHKIKLESRTRFGFQMLTVFRKMIHITILKLFSGKTGPFWALPTHENTLKNSLNSCQIFRWLKFLIAFKWNSFKEHCYTSNKLAEPEHQLFNFTDLCDKNGRLKIFWLFTENFSDPRIFADRIEPCWTVTEYQFKR